MLNSSIFTDCYIIDRGTSITDFIDLPKTWYRVAGYVGTGSDILSAPNSVISIFRGE